MKPPKFASASTFACAVLAGTFCRRRNAPGLAPARPARAQALTLNFLEDI